MESLTIVIPALNEEEAIASTIQRCIDARKSNQSIANLDFIEIIVVSDGSTDRTAELARGFDEIELIEFEHNRGYGAAIKEGFLRGRGTIVGFLDADGTCDPQFFGPMCQTLIDQSADVVLGSRMGPGSKMPPVRRFGNRLFALLLGLICGRRIQDTASGMRVIRRDSLADLYPLPDGLHFTPSMSARVLLNDMRLVEIPMAYEERIGESKLSVLRDGVQFLRTIIESLLCYRPETIFLSIFLFCMTVGVLLAAYPTEYYLRHRELDEGMIYRFVVCYLLGSFGYLLLLATALAHRMSYLARRRFEAQSFWPSIVSLPFSGPFFLGIVIFFVLTGIGFLWPGFVEYATTRQTSLHWSRLLAGAFAFFLALQTLVFGILMKIVSIWKTERSNV